MYPALFHSGPACLNHASMLALFLYSLVAVFGVGFAARNMQRDKRLLLILCALLALNGPTLLNLFAP